MTFSLCGKHQKFASLPTLIFALFTLILVFSFGNRLQAQDESPVASEEVAGGIDCEQLARGKKLFRANCAACHHPVNKMTGPALQGKLAVWSAQDDFKGKTGKEWLYEWIRNWNVPVDAGMPYAVMIKDYDPSVMNLFLALTDEEIDDILYYTDNSQEDAACRGGTEVALTTDGVAPQASDDSTFSTLLMLLIGLLILIALILGRVSTVMSRLIKEKAGEPIIASTPLYKDKRIIVALILAAVVFVGYKTADNAIALGRQQGYQPTQPIAFSHQLHAGTHKIDCQYCHHAASESKHANIPSANICMNCHKAIQKGPTGKTEEIAKIYASTGYDVNTQNYTGEEEPIEWVRIHNLPDHVYFNHAQHVNVGGLECQTCHGPIQEMEEVYQFAPLSMGWCINCHRQTQVKFASNDYYDIYTKFHDDLKSGELDQVTVETIGGTECQKCHY